MSIDKSKGEEIKKKYAEKIKRVGDLNREMKRLEEEKFKDEFFSKRRSVDADFPTYLLGELKCQLIYKPSFETNFIWDIRRFNYNESNSEYNLYENELESEFMIKSGYKKLEIDSTKLESFLEDISKMSIPLKIEKHKFFQLDGVSYGIKLSEYPYSIKIEWNELKDNQMEFNKLKSIVKGFIDFILGIKPSSSLV